jgi:hypothetical protein
MTRVKRDKKDKCKNKHKKEEVVIQKMLGNGDVYQVEGYITSKTLNRSKPP